MFPPPCRLLDSRECFRVPGSPPPPHLAVMLMRLAAAPGQQTLYYPLTTGLLNLITSIWRPLLAVCHHRRRRLATACARCVCVWVCRTHVRRRSASLLLNISLFKMSIDWLRHRHACGSEYFGQDELMSRSQNHTHANVLNILGQF